MSIDDDAYFELMMNNCWKMNNASTKMNDKKGWSDKNDNSGSKSKNTVQENYNAKQQPQSRGQLSAKNNTSNIFSGDEPQRPQTNKGSQRQQVSEPEQHQEEEGVANLDTASARILEKFRERLLSRGGKGMIGLQRQFKIFDDNNSKTLELTEFMKACKDFKVDLNQNEIKILFNAFDNDGSGSVDYNEFLREVRGEMNGFRKRITLKAFDKLDTDRSGVIEIAEVKALYNCKHHPDVKSGKKTEEDVYGEFIETFEMHHGNTKGRRDKRVTREEFLEYYNNISANIDLDEYYEVMMNNAWKLSAQPEYVKNKAYTDKNDTGNPQPRKQPVKTSPFGVSEQKTSYETSNQGRGGASRGNDSQKEETAVDKFKNKLKSRGTRGIMSIRRCFMICDDDGSKSLNFYELDKICNDYRIGLTKTETQFLFKYFDLNGNGSIDYEEFLHGVVGEMNTFRKGMCKRAFEKLDRDKSGVLEVSDIRGVYNGSKHPDVLSGKKTEDEILAEFLDTFEYHFTLLVRFLYNKF
jgi:Ca2+-binding EF-hand superfamily protein